MQRQKQSKSGQGLKKKNLPPIWIPVPCLSLQNSGGYNIPLSAPSHSSTRMVNVKNWNIKWTERQLLDLFYELPFRNMLVTIRFKVPLRKLEAMDVFMIDFHIPVQTNYMVYVWITVRWLLDLVFVYFLGNFYGIFLNMFD